MQNFKELTRAYSLPMVITPFLISFFCAKETVFFQDSSFIINAVLVLTGVILLHLTGNLFDDYIDIIKQLKKGIKLNKINFINKKKARLIINGAYSMQKVVFILLAMLAVSAFIGLHFILLRGNLILFYMLIGIVLIAFYPVSSKYGLAEITLGALFGPILMNASYFALCGEFDVQVFNFSIASGILTSVLLITHSLMDYEYDIQSNKNTVPVILKNKNLTINIISLMLISSWFILIYTSEKYGFPKLFAFIPIITTIPLGIKLIGSLYDYINLKNDNLTPKWYFGIMENWERITKDNFAFFMYRFYLARNLTAIFNITLSISCALGFLPVGREEFTGLRFIF